MTKVAMFALLPLAILLLLLPPAAAEASEQMPTQQPAGRNSWSVELPPFSPERKAFVEEPLQSSGPAKQQRTYGQDSETSQNYTNDFPDFLFPSNGDDKQALDRLTPIIDYLNRQHQQQASSSIEHLYGAAQLSAPPAPMVAVPLGQTVMSRPSAGKRLRLNQQRSKRRSLLGSHADLGQQRMAKVTYDDSIEMEAPDFGARKHKDYLSALASLPLAFESSAMASHFDPKEAKLADDTPSLGSLTDNLLAGSKYSSVSYPMPTYYTAYPAHGHKIVARKAIDKSHPILLGVGAALISFLILSNLLLSIPLFAMTLMSFLGNNMLMPNNMQPNNNGNNQNQNGANTNGRKRRDVADALLEQTVQRAIMDSYRFT